MFQGCLQAGFAVGDHHIRLLEYLFLLFDVIGVPAFGPHARYFLFLSGCFLLV